MNKSDLVLKLAEKHRLTEIAAKEIVDLIFDGFTEELKNNGRIEVRGFGSFSVRSYGSYTGRNPNTGEAVDVKPKRLPFFKVGKALKDNVDCDG
jgi:integration host factor subunit beta